MSAFHIDIQSITNWTMNPSTETENNQALEIEHWKSRNTKKHVIYTYRETEITNKLLIAHIVPFVLRASTFMFNTKWSYLHPPPPLSICPSLVTYEYT